MGRVGFVCILLFDGCTEKGDEDEAVVKLSMRIVFAAWLKLWLWCVVAPVGVYTTASCMLQLLIPSLHVDSVESLHYWRVFYFPPSRAILFQSILSFSPTGMECINVLESSRLFFPCLDPHEPHLSFTIASSIFFFFFFSLFSALLCFVF